MLRTLRPHQAQPKTRSKRRIGIPERSVTASGLVPPLLPIVDTPAVQLTVEEARNAGIRDIVIVTSPGGVIESHFADDGQGLGFVVQEQALGLGHAVALAGERLPPGEAFAVLLPDVLPVGDGLRRMVDVHTTTGASTVALRSVPPEEVSRSFAIANEPTATATATRQKLKHIKLSVTTVEDARLQPPLRPPDTAASHDLTAE